MGSPNFFSFLFRLSYAKEFPFASQKKEAAFFLILFKSTSASNSCSIPQNVDADGQNKIAKVRPKAKR